MRTSTRRLALVAGAIFSLTAAGGIALAQVPPPPPAPPAPPAPPPPPMPPMEAMMAGGHAMVMMGRMGGHGDPAAHAQRLRDVLQLRPDQDGALKTYLDATGPGAMKAALTPDEADDDFDDRMTTPQRLERQAEHMTRMAETFQKRAAATKAFYAALSPAQQKAFDALGPEAGGPRVMIRQVGAGPDARPMGERREERTVIIKRKPS